MISMIRIDDRLIHGQVAVMWSKELGISRIIVPNEKIANNEMQKSALLMAVPSGVKAGVMSPIKAINILNDPRAKDMKILVVANDPKDVYEVLKGINEKPRLNMANYGRINGSLIGKEKITETVYLTNEDKEVLNEIFKMGYDFDYQPLPSDTKQSLKELIGGK